jgi:hypothetical protein
MRAIPVSRPHRSSVTSGSRSKWGRTAHCSRGSAFQLSSGLYRRATGPGRLGVRAVLARPICGGPGRGSLCLPGGGSALSPPSHMAVIQVARRAALHSQVQQVQQANRDPQDRESELLIDGDEAKQNRRDCGEGSRQESEFQHAQDLAWRSRRRQGVRRRMHSLIGLEAVDRRAVSSATPPRTGKRSWRIFSKRSSCGCTTHKGRLLGQFLPGHWSPPISETGSGPAAVAAASTPVPRSALAGRPWRG